MTRQKRPCLPSWPVSLLRCFGFVFGFFSFLSSFHLIRNNFKKFWVHRRVGFLSSTSFICFVVVRLPLHDFQVFSEKKKKNRDTAIKAAANCLVLGRLNAEDTATTSASVVFRLGCKTKVQNLTQKKKKKKKKVSWRRFYILCKLIDWFLSRRKICLRCGETRDSTSAFKIFHIHHPFSVLSFHPASLD